MRRVRRSPQFSASRSRFRFWARALLGPRCIHCSIQCPHGDLRPLESLHVRTGGRASAPQSNKGLGGLRFDSPLSSPRDLGTLNPILHTQATTPVDQQSIRPAPPVEVSTLGASVCSCWSILSTVRSLYLSNPLGSALWGTTLWPCSFISAIGLEQPAERRLARRSLEVQTFLQER